MTKTISFYKKEDLWYADVALVDGPGALPYQPVNEADNLMVLGADTWLEKLAGGRDTVTLEVSTEDHSLSRNLLRICQDEAGATYATEGPEEHLLWLCNVSRFFFGDHPETIYYNVL